MWSVLCREAWLQHVYFADYIALSPGTKAQIQKKVLLQYQQWNNWAKYSEKTKLLRLKSTGSEKMQVHEQVIND